MYECCWLNVTSIVILQKHLYAKLTALHHSSDISKEQHRKLFPLLAFEREKVDVVLYDCENTIVDFNKVLDDRFAYGIVKIDEFLNVDELVNIANESLTKDEQVKILKRTKHSKLDSQLNFADIDENSDNLSEISEIEEEESIDCSQLSIINITSKAKGKEIVNDSMVKDDIGRPSTSKYFDFDYVEVRDSQTDSSDDEDDEIKTSNVCKTKKKVSTETSIPRVVVKQVYGETEKFDTVMNEKGAHYLETNTVVYPNFTCTDEVVFPNQVFFTTGNAENVKPEFNKMIEEDNKRSTDEGFFANQNIVENNITKNSYVFQKQKSKELWVVKSEKQKDVVTKEVVYSTPIVKLNSNEFKVLVNNFSKEHKISKRNARKAVFLVNSVQRKTRFD